MWRRPFFVSATTDELFQPYRGVAFDPQSAWPMSDNIDLRYFVGQDGEIVFFEKVSNPATYTEFLERQAAKEARKAAPRARRVPTEP